MTVMVQERQRGSANGFAMIAASIMSYLLGAAIVAYTSTGGSPSITEVLLALGFVLTGTLLLAGLYSLQPNQAAVLTLFGDYRGSDRTAGLRWANPFYAKRRVSVRAHNFVSERLKVNDKLGNPIEIAAAIVWRVCDTAQATFNVENYEDFVRIQSETAVRHLASCYAYDDMEEPHDKPQVTLRGGGDIVAAALKRELSSRLAQAGVTIDDTKLTHLAYAPEIAGAMLRRQQAEAVLAARRKIVQGAVDMVGMALHGLAEKGLVELDDERRAAMVSNLLVVLVGDKETSPVVNTGTLYA